MLRLAHGVSFERCAKAACCCTSTKKKAPRSSWGDHSQDQNFLRKVRRWGASVDLSNPMHISARFALLVKQLQMCATLATLATMATQNGDPPPAIPLAGVHEPVWGLSELAL